MSNPYLNIILERRKRTPSWPFQLILIGTLSLAGFISQPSVFYFLEAPKIHIGLSGLVFRLSALSIALLGVVIYNQLLRSIDREVLSAHPINPSLFLKATIRDQIVRCLWIPIGLSSFLLPVAVQGHLNAWLVSSGMLTSAWLGGIGMGFCISLGAVWAASAPQLDGVLNAIRGPNPKEQAAFIYAPGFSLLLLGLVLLISIEAFQQVLQAKLNYAILLTLPALFGAVGLMISLRLSKSQFVRATGLLSEIDARWAMVQSETTDGQHVYLEWLASSNPERLRALRQGWRTRRAWVVCPWVLGAMAAISIWGGDTQTAFILSTLGVLVGSAIPGLLKEGDPNWLNLSIGVSMGQIIKSRFEVGLLYSLGAIVPASLISLILLPNGGWYPLLLSFLLSVLSSSFSAWLGVNHRRKILAWYAPVALFLWSIVGGLG